MAKNMISFAGHDWTAVSKAVGTRTPAQVKNYFYDNKKTIARHQDVQEKRAKSIAKAVKGADLADDHDNAMEGTKKKKKKKGKKEATCATPTMDDTLKKLTPNTIETDSSKLGPVSTESTGGCYSETVCSRAGTELIGQQASGENREEQYRQHQLRLHQQQQQLQLQQHQQLQLQQQQLERLVQQQRQEEMYRQHMQQEEMYRQHYRQQEMLQAAQHARQLQQQHHHVQQQNQQFAEPGQNWNQLDRKCCSWTHTFFPHVRLPLLKHKY
jgi:hypothetical protein